MATGVHEDVERGVRPRELVAVQHAEERGVGQQGPEPGLLRSAAHQHQPDARQPVDVGQQLELLLGCQPADVPDQKLAVRRQLGVERLVALGRLEEHLVHAPRPAGDGVDAEPASWSMLAVDGASVRSTPRWIRRVSDSMARAPPGTAYRSANPTRSVW